MDQRLIQGSEVENLSAIQALRRDFSTQFHEVVTSTEDIKGTIGECSEIFSTVDHHISAVEDRISWMVSDASATQGKILVQWSRPIKPETSWTVQTIRVRRRIVISQEVASYDSGNRSSYH